MSRMSRDHVELVNSLLAATTAEDAMNALSVTLAPLGWRPVLYGFTPLLETQHAKTGWYRAFANPVDWLSDDDQSLARLTERLELHSGLFRRPVTLKQLAEYYAGSLASGEEDVFDKQGCDIPVGLVLPIRDRFPLGRAYLFLLTACEKGPATSEENLSRDVASLIRIAGVFHANLFRPMLVPDAVRLSPREAQCLGRTKRGMQAKQIAFELGTNERTVEKQLSSARRRMGARTKVQAAVIAVALGLIPESDGREPEGD